MCQVMQKLMVEEARFGAMMDIESSDEVKALLAQCQLTARRVQRLHAEDCESCADKPKKLRGAYNRRNTRA